MSDKPINLNKFRKARAAEARRKQADENALRHGRSKAEKLREAMRDARARAMLERHRLEEDE